MRRKKKKRIQDDVLAWVPWETELEASAYPLWGAGSQGRKSEGSKEKSGRKEAE